MVIQWPGSLFLLVVFHFWIPEGLTLTLCTKNPKSQWKSSAIKVPWIWELVKIRAMGLSLIQPRWCGSGSFELIKASSGGSALPLPRTRKILYRNCLVVRYAVYSFSLTEEFHPKCTDQWLKNTGWWRQSSSMQLSASTVQRVNICLTKLQDSCSHKTAAD